MANFVKLGLFVKVQILGILCLHAFAKEFRFSLSDTYDLSAVMRATGSGLTVTNKLTFVESGSSVGSVYQLWTQYRGLDIMSNSSYANTFCNIINDGLTEPTY